MNQLSAHNWHPVSIEFSGARKENYCFTNYLVTFWIVLTIILGKSFCYAHVGPIFITEFVLLCLIISNLDSLKFSDIAFFGILIFYILGGVFQWGFFKFVFIGKDIAFLYYLIFLRFFPRDLPEKFTNIIYYSAIFVSCYVFVSPFALKGEIMGFSTVNKYAYSITFLFAVNYYLLNKKGDKFSIKFFVLIFTMALLSNFKTLLFAILLYPLMIKYRKNISHLVNFKCFLIGFIAMLFIIYSEVTQVIMYNSVGQLNNLMELLNLSKRFTTGTSTWRAEIWSHSLQTLINQKNLLFGEFPGHNFMDSNYLKLNFFLQGGDLLGIVRSGHNIALQIVMKTGLVGILSYLYFFFNWTASICTPRISIFIILVFLLAFTADLLENPMAGASFYCLLSVLMNRYHQTSKQTNENIEHKLHTINFAKESL